MGTMVACATPACSIIRMPTALDVPIEAVIIETPVPDVPYGLRGVGEVPIVPVRRLHRQCGGARDRPAPMTERVGGDQGGEGVARGGRLRSAAYEFRATGSDVLIHETVVVLGMARPPRLNAARRDVQRCERSRLVPLGSADAAISSRPARIGQLCAQAVTACARCNKHEMDYLIASSSRKCHCNDARFVFNREIRPLASLLCEAK